MAIFDQGITGQIIWFFLFMIFISLYPKYMLYKMISEMEEVVRTLDGYTKDAVKLIIKTSKEKAGTAVEPAKEKEIESMLDFFVIPPVELDPYGILKKLEYLMDRSEEKFEFFAKSIAQNAPREWEDNIIALLKGAIGLNMVTKILRHYVEFAKKTGNIQITMLIHMNLAMIKKIGSAYMEGVKGIAEAKPIGDGIGPLIAAHLIKGEKAYEEVEKDVACYETEIEGKKAYILKALGPGATLGKIGEAVKKVAANKGKIAKIITIDAGLKLEGEESGKITYGIGAAIGDPGPEKAKIEEAAMSLNIPLEAIVIRMSVEEAISPMNKKIASSVNSAVSLIKNSLLSVEAGKAAIVVGVGNTCGIGNSEKEVEKLEFPEEKKEKLSFSEKLMKKVLTPPMPSAPPKEEKEEGK